MEQIDGALLPRVTLTGTGDGSSACTSGAAASESTMACVRSLKLSSDLRRDPWFGESSQEPSRALSVDRRLEPAKKTSSSWTVCNGRSPAAFSGLACLCRLAPSQEADILLRMDDLLLLVLLVAASEGGGALVGEDSSLKNEPSRRAERRPLLAPELWRSRWPREPPFVAASGTGGSSSEIETRQAPRGVSPPSTSLSSASKKPLSSLVDLRLRSELPWPPIWRRSHSICCGRTLPAASPSSESREVLRQRRVWSSCFGVKIAGPTSRALRSRLSVTSVIFDVLTAEPGTAEPFDSASCRDRFNQGSFVGALGAGAAVDSVAHSISIWPALTTSPWLERTICTSPSSA